MTLHSVSAISVLVLGLALSPAVSSVVAQQPGRATSEVVTRPSEGNAGGRVVTTVEEDARRTVERSVVEGSSIDGDPTVLAEVSDETVRLTPERSQRTRQEFVIDANGRQALVSTLQERSVVRPDGGQTIVRDYTEPDANNRSRATRRELEQVVAEGNGVFSTQIDVELPSLNGGFVASERVEQRERREGDRVLELDRTTYADPSGRGVWEAQERRVTSSSYDGGTAETVESVYRSDGAGNLVHSDQIVSKEWTAPGGQEFRTEDIYTTDAPNSARSSTPRLHQQIETVQTNRSGGRSETTRTVRESRGNRMEVVERVVERARPDGRGGVVIERETQQPDLNGQMQTVSVTQARESDR